MNKEKVIQSLKEYIELVEKGELTGFVGIGLVGGYFQMCQYLYSPNDALRVFGAMEVVKKDLLEDLKEHAYKAPH